MSNKQKCLSYSSVCLIQNITINISNYVEKSVCLSEDSGGKSDMYFQRHSHKYQVQSGFNVSWKLLLNLYSWRWLSPSRNLAKYSIPFRFWLQNMLFTVGLRNFKIFFLKTLRRGAFWIPGSSLFHLMLTCGKKAFLKKLCLILKRGILFAFLVEYGLVNLGIISKIYFGVWSFKIL